MAYKIFDENSNNYDEVIYSPSSSHQNEIYFESINKLSTRISKRIYTITYLLILSLLCLSAIRGLEAKEKFHKGSTSLNVFDSEEELAIEFSKFIANLSDKFVKERGFFTIALTGDSLINSMRILLEPPYLNQIDWAKWYVFWADERFVSKNSPISNYKIDNDDFLSKVPIPKENIISIDDRLTVEEAAIEYELRLRKLVQDKVISTPNNVPIFPKFDAMLLGMGPDGHVASLFPNHLRQLEENMKWVTYIKDSPKPPPQRITMTFPLINYSSNIAFVVMGKNMAKRVSDVFNGNRSYIELPAKNVSPIEGELMWFLDKGAASLLK